MSLVSRTAQYALRAMALLAAQEDRVTVKDLAQNVGAPQPYLARIIMTLADKGMVDARRGPGGGLKLGRKPDDISLMEIVTCFDGDGLFNECALGLPGCSETTYKCPIHDEWGEIRETIRSWWQDTSLAQFSSEHTTACMRQRAHLIEDESTGRGPRRGRW